LTFGQKICKIFANDESNPPIELDEILSLYQTRRSTLFSNLFEKILIQNCERDVSRLANQITESVDYLLTRMVSIQKVEDLDIKESAELPLKSVNLSTKETLLRSLSLHSQLLTRASYFEENEIIEEVDFSKITSHIRAINDVFYLLEVSSS
jgi:hypothetical protein